MRKKNHAPSATSYVPIIGLEIHVELKTKSKMFCGCSADYFGHRPNTHCCPVCLGLPGSLPVPNKKAIEWTVMVGLVLNCKIPAFAKFDRKNYFYPDLPKGYQISQYDKPLAVNGELNIKYQKSKTVRKIRIRRVHLEEDTGKMIHTKIDGEKCTLIDFNRSGVPLLEIVTEPDMRSGEEAKFFLQKLQQILRYTGVSECDMEKGSMRCEPNVSIAGGRWQVAGGKAVKSYELPDYKVEIKNLNSFKFVQKAIDYEITRQARILEKGGKVRQETRGWDEKKSITLPQRGKEEASDYRYFPEPDIPPIRWTKLEIAKIKAKIPELPDQKMSRFIEQYGLSEYDAQILTSQRKIADYYEEALSAWRVARGRWQKEDAKQIANWIINKRIDINETLPAELIKMILAKLSPSTISKPELKRIVGQVLLDNKKAVGDYKRGKRRALMFLVGEVMGRTRGKADPKLVAKLLNAKIKTQNAKRKK